MMRSALWPGLSRSPAGGLSGRFMRGGVAFLVAGVREETRRYLRWKLRAKEPLDARSPLFLSNQRRRVSLRRIQFVFREWPTAAGFETVYPFRAAHEEGPLDRGVGRV